MSIVLIRRHYWRLPFLPRLEGNPDLTITCFHSESSLEVRSSCKGHATLCVIAQEGHIGSAVSHATPSPHQSLSPYTWAKNRKFWTDKFDTWSKRKFWLMQLILVASRLHELLESKFPFVSRIEFICSKLANFYAHVSGSLVHRFLPIGIGYPSSCASRTTWLTAYWRSIRLRRWTPAATRRALVVPRGRQDAKWSLADYNWRILQARLFDKLVVGLTFSTFLCVGASLASLEIYNESGVHPCRLSSSYFCEGAFDQRFSTSQRLSNLFFFYIPVGLPSVQRSEAFERDNLGTRLYEHVDWKPGP